MSLLKSKLLPICIICGTLLAVLVLTQNAYAGAECASLGGGCDDGGDWDPMAKLEEMGKPITNSQEQTATKWPEKSRQMRWNVNDSGSEDEENTASETPKIAEAPPQRAVPTKVAEDPANIVRSNEAREILAPLEDITDADILLDVSEDSSMHIAGSLVIPYMEFDVRAGILKPVPEISRILGDAGISREDSVVIYGECLLRGRAVCSDLRLLDDEEPGS